MAEQTKAGHQSAGSSSVYLFTQISWRSPSTHSFPLADWAFSEHPLDLCLTYTTQQAISPIGPRWRKWRKKTHAVSQTFTRHAKKMEEPPSKCSWLTKLTTAIDENEFRSTGKPRSWQLKSTLSSQTTSNHHPQELKAKANIPSTLG